VDSISGRRLDYGGERFDPAEAPGKLSSRERVGLCD